MKILIQGAGIAGLSLAVALNRHGMNPTIIEQSSFSTQKGYWVYIYDNGRKVLRQLGLENALDSVGYVVPSYRITDLKGDTIHRMNFELLAPDVIAATSIQRHDLHAILQKAVSSDTEVRFGTTITAFENTSTGVSVLLSDGTRETFDLLVAADGIHSELRTQVFPEVEEKYCGMHSWLFSVTDAAFIPDEIIHQVSAGAYAVQYPHGKERCGIYLAAKTELGKYDRDYDGRELLPEIFKNFGNPIPETIATITPDTPMFHDYIKKVEHDHCYNKRIVITGDAEHAMSPLLGQGSSLAMEDALVLTEELAKNDEIDTALNQYQKRRVSRIKDIQRLSNLLILILNTNNNFEAEILEELVRHLAPPNLLLDSVMKRVEKVI